MKRLDFDHYMLQLAQVAAKRGTCAKRQVGAVVADENNMIVAVSYNGVPSKQPHCLDAPCKALTLEAPVSHLGCRAIHAETNALLLAGRHAHNGTIAITTSPCYECAKIIVNSRIKRLIIGEVNRLFYQENAAYSSTPAALLQAANIEIKEII